MQSLVVNHHEDTVSSLRSFLVRMQVTVPVADVEWTDRLVATTRDISEIQ